MTALAGVNRLAFARTLPLGGTNIREGALDIERHPAPVGREPSAAVNIVSPGYFALVRMPVVAGRAFTPPTARGAAVAVVNQAFAALFWPSQPALRKRIGTRTSWASCATRATCPSASAARPPVDAARPDARPALTLLVRSALRAALAPRSSVVHTSHL